MGSSNDLTPMFKALGDPTRRRIFEFLRACCCPVAVDAGSGEVRPVDGPTVGDVCCHVTGSPDQSQSTISHHLKELRTAGLIVMERRGKHIVCGVDQEALQSLATYFGTSSSADIGGANNCCE